MENIKIIPVKLSDLAQLQKIGRLTFFETFAAGNTEENMKNYLEEGFSEDKLCRELEKEIGLPVYDIIKNEYEA